VQLCVVLVAKSCVIFQATVSIMIDNISVVMIVCGIRGKVIISVLRCIVYHNCAH